LINCGEIGITPRMNLVDGVIVQGHRVASGLCGDERFPEGTIRAQIPEFKKLGLNLEPYFPGTLNVDVSPFIFVKREPWKCFPGIDWCKYFDPENFSFFRVQLEFEANTWDGLIYLPHPSSKPDDHPASVGVVEVLAPKIEGLKYGASVKLRVRNSECIFEEPS